MEKNKTKPVVTTSKQVGTIKQIPANKNTNTQKKTAPLKEDIQKSKNAMNNLINDYKNLEN
jgi:hypothetical protein